MGLYEPPHVSQLKSAIASNTRSASLFTGSKRNATRRGLKVVRTLKGFSSLDMCFSTRQSPRRTTPAGFGFVLWRSEAAGESALLTHETHLPARRRRYLRAAAGASAVHALVATAASAAALARTQRPERCHAAGLQHRREHPSRSHPPRK